MDQAEKDQLETNIIAYYRISSPNMHVGFDTPKTGLPVFS